MNEDYQIAFVVVEFTAIFFEQSYLQLQNILWFYFYFIT